MILFDVKLIGEETIGTMHGPSTQPTYPPFLHGTLLDDLRRALNIPIHCYCGYWNIPPGPRRKAHRAERQRKLLEPK